GGLFHGNPDPDESGNDTHPGPSWNQNNPLAFLSARRGYTAASSEMLLLNPDYPTFFVRPFKSPDSGTLVPLQTMMTTGADCTLLRQGQPQAGSNIAWPLFSAATDEPYHDAARNPYFGYQPIIRLDNLVTTRSNVYAVWITIGFFEVEPAPTKADFAQRNGNLTEPLLTQLYNRVYPDGYMLGREDGADTGAIRRLRGFYVIDRSLPTGFEPGVDVNLENVVRLRRRIE
ncbi:MAG: hypothetical protein IT424_09915, partial [Pirellulales bacterium]|nr:hypothetical protein [Pirellulales bacterium]